MNYKEMRENALQMMREAMEVYENPESDKEAIDNANVKMQDSANLKAKSEKLVEAKAAVLEMAELQNQDTDRETKVAQQKPVVVPDLTFGQYLQHVRQMAPDRISRYLAANNGQAHPALAIRKNDQDESDRETKEKPAWTRAAGGVNQETKDLVENTGASGGFLVPVEYRATLLSTEYEDNPIRQRATVIPMRRRQLQVPTLDQTGTAAGQTRQYGGVVATWTEEATEKHETQPDFRQIDLVAHKLVTYTEASDELLADSAIALATLLTSLFSGAIRWEEEYTFLQGTGAGQPLGVLVAGATIVEPRAVAGTISVDDIMMMLQQHIGVNPVWHITRNAMATLLQLNGPAGNPAYVFIDNMRDGMPMRLMGFPIFWTEKLPTLGVQGDILLASWPNYYVGDRQQTTIDTSFHFRFQHDLTAWRAVHRVDGQPALSQPITLADGVSQVSPFVILGDVAT